jgi:hypothetical protein
MPERPRADGIVLPPMPSWPQSVPRWVATKAASIWSGSNPASTLSTAAEKASDAICS